MGTSRRLLGLVLLLVFVGGGGYLLYREHERQEAERASAVSDGPATDAPAAAGEAGGTAPAATADVAPAVGAAPADATDHAGAAVAPPTGGTGGAAGETATAGSATTAGTPGGAAPDGASSAAAEGSAAGEAGSTATAGGADAGTAVTTAAAPQETISQPEAVEPAAPGAPSFDIVRVEPGGDAVMAGRSEPGMVIALFANGQEIGRTRANDSGEWVITLERPLGPGEYVITVVGATPDGVRQVESVDRIAVSIPEAKTEPPMVALMSPNAPTKVLQQPEAPSTAVAAASAAPANETGEASAAAAGATGGEAAAGGASGAIPAPASTADQAPASGGAGEAPGVVAGAAPPPAWAQPFAGAGGAATAPATAPQAGPAAAIPAITGLAVGLVEKDGDRLTVSGASLPGATVRVYVNDAPLGDAVADAAGRWTFTGRHPVEAGDHTVRADQVDPATGAVVARAAVPFEVLSAAEIASAPATPAAPAIELPADPAAPADTGSGPAATQGAPAAAPVDAAKPVQAAAAGPRKIRIRKGDDLWTLAERYYGKRAGVRYTAIYRANRKQIRDPDLIYPGQVFVIPR